MNPTGIAWTDRTWNPTTGCSKVSQGCKHCYAERIFPRPYPGRKFTDVRMHPDRLDQPLRIGKPQRIFVNSMSDLFHEDVPDEFIDRVFTTIRRCEVIGKGHVFQVLTKRPQRMLDFMRPIPVPSNLWLGVSVEDQETADERIPLLLQTPAAVRFISAEPLLGPLDVYGGDPDPRLGGVKAGPGLSLEQYWKADGNGPFPGLDWVIAGGESGPKARPSHPEWYRSLRDQCAAAHVPFFFKQWGDWWPISQMGSGDGPGCSDYYRDHKRVVLQIDGREEFAFPPGAMTCFKVGAKASGNLLDGKTHEEFPG